MTLTDYMCQKKKEEDSPDFKIVSTHRYNDSKITEKEQRKTYYNDQKQHTQHKDQQNNYKQKGKMGKINCMDISSDK